MTPPIPAPNESLYALYHVNTKTGQRVRYPRDVEAMPRAAAEEFARGANQSKFPGSAYPAPWETQALPEVQN
jgi:hypothetical protein